MRRSKMMTMPTTGPMPERFSCAASMWPVSIGLCGSVGGEEGGMPQVYSCTAHHRPLVQWITPRSVLFSELLLVGFDGARYGVQCVGPAGESVYRGLDRLFLESLILLEEVLQLFERVFVDIPNVFHIIKTDVLHRHRDHFVVRLSVVRHFHKANWTY